jgi:hypothetical protein
MRSHQPFQRSLVDTVQRKTSICSSRRHRFRLGAGGTSGSNPLSSSGESNANLTPGGWGERMTSTEGSRVKAAIGVSITDPVANIGLRNDRCRH